MQKVGVPAMAQSQPNDVDERSESATSSKKQAFITVEFIEESEKRVDQWQCQAEPTPVTNHIICLYFWMVLDLRSEIYPGEFP